MNSVNKYFIDTSLIITSFAKENLQEILTLFRLNTPLYFHPDEEKDMMDYLQIHGDTYFIASINGKVVGACGYHLPNLTEGRISWTFIHPSYKRKGIGKALIDHCFALIETYPVEKITVWTSNLSWQFFGKFGFVLTSIEKDYWAKGLDLYYMEIPKKDA